MWGFLILLGILAFLYGVFWMALTTFPRFSSKVQTAQRTTLGGLILAVVSILGSAVQTSTELAPLKSAPTNALASQVQAALPSVKTKAQLKAERKRNVQQQYTRALAVKKAKVQARYERAQAVKKVKAQAQYERAQAIARAKVERKAALDAEPSPVSAELSVQTSSDNYGVEPYFILKDSSDQEIGSTGRARLILTVKDYANDTESTVYDQTIDVSYGAFSIGTRGIGAFKRGATFFKFKKISTEKLSGENGHAYLTFVSHRGEVIKAKEFTSYP